MPWWIFTKAFYFLAHPLRGQAFRGYASLRCFALNHYNPLRADAGTALYIWRKLLSMDEKMVKIVFHFESDITDITVETMWATEIDAGKGLYKIDNIPFYVPLVASSDIVFAEYDDDEQRLVYKYTVAPSGNSTIAVFTVDEKSDIQNIRDEFKKLGCETEGFTKTHFTMEVLFDTVYTPIRAKLMELEKHNVIYYAENCLSSKHRSEY